MNATTPPVPTGEMKTLWLQSDGNTFIVRYEVGREAEVVEALSEMTQRPEPRFDWFNAAVMSQELGQHLAKELKGKL